MSELTAKQQRFVDEYLVDLNATQAAIRAGYSQKTAGQIGDENLKKPEIAAAVQKAMDERAKKVGVSAEYVLSTIIDTIERCRQAAPVLDRKGEPVLVTTPLGSVAPAYTFEANAVLKGAELLGKHLKMFTDKTELTGKDGGPVETVATTRPQMTKEEWLAAHGVGTATRPAD
jgi:phage terminase small subunit